MTFKSMFIAAGMLAAAFVAGPARAQETAAARAIVTIVPFETGRTGWVPPAGYGQIMAERLGQRLVESGQYRVLDSELLPREPGISRPDFGSVQSWRDRAERAGASYLLIGSVVQYSKEQHNRSGGGAAAFVTMIAAARFHVPIGPFAAGGRSTQTQNVIGVSVRMIDVRTGEIVTIATGEGVASRTDRAGGGFGVIHGAPVGGGFSDSRTGSASAMLDQATRQAIDQASEAITKAAVRLHGD